MPKRNEAPRTRLITGIAYLRPQKEVLGNGMPVYFMKGGIEEFVKIEVVFHAGSYYQSKPLLAFATTNLLRTGTASRSREQINEKFDYYSAHLQLEAQKDIVSVSLYVLNKHLEPALELLSDILINPAFPGEEMHAFLKNQKQIHLINQKKVQHLARTYFAELIYGEDHPYGYRVKPEDFDQLRRQDLVDFHRDYFDPANAFCIVSGHLPQDLALLMTKYLGGTEWTHPSRPSAPHYTMLSSGSRKVLLQMPEAVQSAIRVGKQLFNRTHPAYHRLKIANAMLGGYFGSRLMQNIRQEKGYTYGISSNMISLVRNGYFFVATQTGTDVTQAALEEIYNELADLRKKPASREELETLKHYLSGAFLRSFDGPFAQAERFKELVVFGLGYSHYDDYLRTLKEITAEDIMAAAEDYLNEDEMMEVVVGR